MALRAPADLGRTIHTDLPVGASRAQVESYLRINNIEHTDHGSTFDAILRYVDGDVFVSRSVLIFILMSNDDKVESIGG